MTSIQMPHKVFEKAYCRKVPTPFDCQILSIHFTKPNVPLTSFETRHSSLGKNAGRSLFTNRNILKGSMMAFEQAPKLVHFEPFAMHLIGQHYEMLGGKSGSYSVYGYMYGYRFDSHFYGDDEESYDVDASMMTFVNHGCNLNSNMIGLYEDYYCNIPPCYELNEQSLSKDEVTKFRKYVKPGSSPVTLRHLVMGNSLIAARNIAIGEEIFQNYLTYEKTEKELFATAKALKSVCSGLDAGEVTSMKAVLPCIQLNNSGLSCY